MIDRELCPGYQACNELMAGNSPLITPLVRGVMRQSEQTTNFQSNVPIPYEISTKVVLNSCTGESRKLIPSGHMIFSSRTALWGTELCVEHRNLINPHSYVLKLTA